MSNVKYSFTNSVYWGGVREDSSYRTKGPSWIHANGTVLFEENVDTPGLSRRLVGPAKIYPDGNVLYINHSGIHRTDGPAIITADGSKMYYIQNVQLSEIEFFSTYGVV